MEIPNKFPLIPILFFIVLTTLHYPCQGQNSAQDYLDAHNAARWKVGVGSMIWNQTLADFAQKHVSKCIIEHSHGPYGENYAWRTGSFIAKDAVDMWVAEKPYYDYDSNSCVGGECRHYTQVVWSNSVRLGCGRAPCYYRGWRVWFVSCNYDPPGNFPGQHPYIKSPTVVNSSK